MAKPATTDPQFPIYIPSKGRAKSRLTVKALERMGVPFHVVVEQSQLDDYAQVIDRSKLLVLDPAYQRDYDTFDALGDSKSKGPGPARNFIWDHAISRGYAWHWVMDDNIRRFYRLNRNLKVECFDGTPFRVMEDFVLRYQNIGMAGPCYAMFVIRKRPVPPFITGTRIYSCNLIRNDVPFRWRGRYNEDTDLSLRMLKAGWVTVQFNAFLQSKVGTQTVRGGNTAEFYEREGTVPKSVMLAAMHPDVTRLMHRFGRDHHIVDYRQFKQLKLLRKPDVEIKSGVDDYGMRLKRRTVSGAFLTVDE